MLHSLDIPAVWSRLLNIAERHPRRAVALSRQLLQHISEQDQLGQAWALYTLGWSCLRWERLSDAQTHLQQARAIFAALSMPLAVLQARRALLITKFVSGADARLQADLKSLIIEYQSDGFAVDAARTAIYQISHLNLLGRPREALALAEQYAPLLNTHGVPLDQAQLLRVTAIAVADLGMLDQADSLLNEAITTFSSLRAWSEVAKCWIERAWNNQRREAFQRALPDLEQALKIFQRLDMPLNIAFCEKSIGMVMARLGNYDQGLSLTFKARNQLIALNRLDQAADCDLNLGNIAYYSGLFDLARTAYRRAEQVYAALGRTRLYYISKRNQALVLRAEGQPEAALKLLIELEKAHSSLDDRLELAEIHFAQAQALHDLGTDDQALELLQRTQVEFRALGNAPSAGECHLVQGWIYLAQEQIEAATMFLNAARHDLSDRPYHLWRVDYGLGRCAYMQKDLRLAQSYFLQANTTVTKLRRSTQIEHASSQLFTQAFQLYRDALHLAIEQQDLANILLLAEQQRALTFQRQLNQGRIHLPPDLQHSYEKHSHALLTLLNGESTAEDIDTTLQGYIECLLQARHIPLFYDEDLGEPLDIDHLRSQFNIAYPNGWITLFYIEDGSNLLIISFDQDRILLTRTHVDMRLQRLLEQACNPRYRLFTYLDLPKVRGQTDIPWSILTELSSYLIPSSVRERLTPDLRLLIVPSGITHAVPWAALRLGGSFLCEQAVPQILPALSLWSTLAARTVQGDQALLLGCSSFSGRGVELPHTLAELDQIVTLWPTSVTRLENAAATRKILLDLAVQGALRQYRLLHFATHAQLISNQGLLAHLKLWDTDLLLDDVMQLNLSGALVVLSTCEGGAGDVLPGEEVLSLSRAFLVAGARDVIASMWPAYDQHMQALLTEVYLRLSHGYDPPTALAHAQRAIICTAEQIEPHASPLVWGSLQALGVGTGVCEYHK